MSAFNYTTPHHTTLALRSSNMHTIACVELLPEIDQHTAANLSKSSPTKVFLDQTSDDGIISFHCISTVRTKQPRNIGLYYDAETVHSTNCRTRLFLNHSNHSLCISCSGSRALQMWDEHTSVVVFVSRKVKILPMDDRRSSPSSGTSRAEPDLAGKRSDTVEK